MAACAAGGSAGVAGVPAFKMERIKPWLLTFVGVVVSLAIINRVPFMRSLVYGPTASN